MSNRIEASKPSGDAEKAPAPGAAPAAPPAKGGLAAFLPLLVNIALMPVLAFAMTKFVLLPKLQPGGGGGSSHAASAAGEHGKPAAKSEGGHGAKEGGHGKGKVTTPLPGKVLVNVAGTMGTRYLLANITLVGDAPQLKDMVEKNDAQLRDAAASALANKTINDLEKPGARNLIRTELMSVFNNILGGGAVNEIYLTEFAIQ